MDTLGPIYPFGPLPPPDNPSSGKRMSQIDSKSENGLAVPPQTGIAGSSKDFSALLNNKKIEMLVKQDVSLNASKELEQAARDFEAFFIASLLKKFYDANMKSELFPKAAGSDIFMDMFLEGIADEIANSPNGLGVSEMVMRSVQDRLEL